MDAKHQIIVAADLNNQAADSVQLIPMVDRVRRNLGRNPQQISADAGYCSEANLMVFEQRRVDPLGQLLVGADDLEVLADEDVVRPVDADVVNLVLAIAQLHNTVDYTARVGGQRSFRRLIRRRSADDRPRPLTVVRRDLADLL